MSKRRIQPLPPPRDGNVADTLRHLASRIVQVEARVKEMEDKIVTGVKAGNDRQGRQYIIVQR